MDVTSSLRSLLPYGRRSIGISQLVCKLEGYLPPAEVERIQDAYDFAFEAHQGQRRRSGEPYITHPVAVADPPPDLRLAPQTLIAAILHDVIEDTPTLKEEINRRFGQEVADLVDGVSKLDQIQFKSREEAQAESFRKMLLAMVRDIRVIMVKLADRTHNMRTLGAMPLAERRTGPPATRDRPAGRGRRRAAPRAGLAVSARSTRAATVSSRMRCAVPGATRSRWSAASP